MAGRTNSPAEDDGPPKGEQTWNWHVQNTDIVQFHPGFPALYSGPNSLRFDSEVKETVSLDFQGGWRLWPGAEVHGDLLVWQGLGFSNTRGIEGFPNGEAFRLGSELPNVNLARLFLRQDFALGPDRQAEEDSALILAGQRPVSRFTVTVGKFSAKDVFDTNGYANDPRTQFLNWGLMANEAWDFPADALGYITGASLELNEPKWAVRYGFFQMPRNSNGTAIDSHYLDAWGMVAEFERRFSIGERPGAIRVLAFLNRAQMGSFQETLDHPTRPADIQATRAYRLKFGFGVNMQQEIWKNIGAFMRLGWNDGKTESWCFADVDRTATAGISIKGSAWRRPQDTVGLAGGLNAISRVHRDFFAAGGTGILAGDGALRYGYEKFLECYYDFRLWKTVHLTADYQFVTDPAYNEDRGPVSIVSGRVHWEF